RTNSYSGATVRALTDAAEVKRTPLRAFTGNVLRVKRWRRRRRCQSQKFSGRFAGETARSCWACRARHRVDYFFSPATQLRTTVKGMARPAPGGAANRKRLPSGDRSQPAPATPIGPANI